MYSKGSAMSTQKWYQMLTHDINGNFSKSATAGLVSVIASIGIANYLIDKKEKKNKWQESEDNRKATTSLNSLVGQQR